MAKKKDERIKKYFLKNGEARYKFRLYAGVDPMTGKKKLIDRKGFKTDYEAYMNLIRLEIEIKENGLPEQEIQKKFSEIYELWLENYKHTVKESTLVNTLRYFERYILPIFGDKFINKIDVMFCQKALNDWYKKTKTNYKRYMNLTSNIFKYAMSIGYSNDNPMSKVTVPRVQKKVNSDYKIEFYTKKELIQFLNVAEENIDLKEFTFFRVLAFTGMRKGEVLALNWNDINLIDNSVDINKTVSRGFNNRLIINPPKNKYSERIISVDAETISILRTWKKEQQIQYLKLGFNTLTNNQFVFSNEKNEVHDPTISSQWLRHVYKHDSTLPKIGAHGFRHTHASLLFEAGVPLKEVQVRLGHADIQTTANIYTHLTDKKKEQTGNKFADFMSM